MAACAASALRLERWQALSSADRQGFPHLCPDLVVELVSPGDRLSDLRETMTAYRANGAALGWLLLPQTRSVGRGGTELKSFSAADGSVLVAGEEFPGLQLDLEELWTA